LINRTREIEREREREFYKDKKEREMGDCDEVSDERNDDEGDNRLVVRKKLLWQNPFSNVDIKVCKNRSVITCNHLLDRPVAFQ
jgi:hypothetical protein